MTRTSIFFILLLLIFVSCNKDNDDFDIGGDLVESHTSVVMIDTFSVKLSTVVYDSIFASAPGVALIGNYSNETIGDMESKFYFNIDMGNNDDLIDDEDIFDSITVSLGYSEYYQGDTTELQEYYLYRLTERLKPDDGNTYVYNTTEFDHEETPIDTLKFSPRPFKEDDVEQRINDDFGKELVDLMLDGGDDISSNDRFQEYIKGFVLESSPDNNLILGFDTDTTSIKFNIYTHETLGHSNQSVISFYISNNGDNFNGTIADRSGTNYESLITMDEELPSSQTDDLTYIQAGAGIYTRIDFPSMESIFSYTDKLLVKAELILVPSQINDFERIPESLIFYDTEKDNSQGDMLTYTTSTGEEMPWRASLSLDEPYNFNPYYEIDITNYLLSELSNNSYDHYNGLLASFSTATYYNSVEYLFLNDDKSNESDTKLKLYFLKYEADED